MFLGLRTAIYHVDDIAKGRARYAQVPGFELYFDQPFYVGFNVGGYELVCNRKKNRHEKRLLALELYWDVENAAAACQRIIELGATV